MTIFLRNLINNEIVPTEDMLGAIEGVKEGRFEFLPEFLVDGATLNKAFRGDKKLPDPTTELVEKHKNYSGQPTS